MRREKGREPPAEFLNPPKLPAYLVWYANAFWRLNNDRPIGMGLGPIPFVAIDAFARRYRIEDPDEFDRFLTLIRAQDSEYLRIRNRAQNDRVLDEVSTDDASGVKSLLARLAAKGTESEPSSPSSTEADHH